MSSIPSDDEDENLSGEEAEGGFDEDIEALRRACLLTGADPDDCSYQSLSVGVGNACPGGLVPVCESDGDDDLELVRSIRDRFSMSNEEYQHLSVKPINTIPPVTSDDEEDDFETLRAIQRRFAAYDKGAFTTDVEVPLKNPDQVQHQVSETHLKKECYNKLSSISGIECPNSEELCNTAHNPSNVDQNSSSAIWKLPNAYQSLTSPLQGSGLPKSALAFIDAIKKNRSCQKLLRSKLIHIEAKLEENKGLKDRFKILKDFQVSCKRRIGRALSQKKDPRVQLISVEKLCTSKDLSKVKDKKVSAMLYGPVENSHVAKYKMALTMFPLSLERKKWSKAEKENLGKGIKQQFQEMALQISVAQFSGTVESSGDSNDIDNILESIKDFDFTPEKIREFLPKVDWERLASMYVGGRSGAECQTRWLNYEDPLINHNPWTAIEDKNLLFIIQEKGINNWFDIAVSLGTNRTPCQCLSRYQRSLNASILKREWTKEDDDKLRSAVETIGVGDWQAVASALEGRAGTQCSNRWKKSLDPARTRRGSFTPVEDKRLKIAVMLFGPKNWNKKAQFLPGRNQVQCRERWYNCLDPSLKRGNWTDEEDQMLSTAIREHGYSWAKVATCVPSRTDNECRRRWTKLFPNEVPLLQEARRIQKAAFIGNFVDRESERSTLLLIDFQPTPITNPILAPENDSPSQKRKRKLSQKPKKVKSKKAKTQTDEVMDPVDISTLISALPKKIRTKRTGRKTMRTSDKVDVSKNGSQSVGNNENHMLQPDIKESKLTSSTSVKSADYNTTVNNKERDLNELCRGNDCLSELMEDQNFMDSSATSSLSERMNNEFLDDSLFYLEQLTIPNGDDNSGTNPSV